MHPRSITTTPLRFFCLTCLLSLAVFCPVPAAAGNAPDLMLANVYEGHADLDDYWVSEKYDGVRAYWDGQRFVSRQGNVYHAPAWFTAGFPGTPLDGELWMGRGTFADLSGTVRTQEPDDARWRKVRFMVFDMPGATGDFDRRLRQLTRVIAKHPSPYLKLVRQFRVAGRDELRQRLEAVVAQGGEGLMLHRGSSMYRDGRSDDLLKVKTYDDAEAVVVGHLPGKGKYTDMLGALLVETPEQLTFRIGTGFSDAERQNPPPLGSTITYKYFGLTANGIPRFASFLRVRYPVPTTTP